MSPRLLYLLTVVERDPFALDYADTDAWEACARRGYGKWAISDARIRAGR